MNEKYFVEYTQYSGFGQLSVELEKFSNWIDMRKFLHQLKPEALLPST